MPRGRACILAGLCGNLSSPPAIEILLATPPCTCVEATMSSALWCPVPCKHDGCCCAGLMAGFNRLKKRFSKSRDPFNGQPYSGDESSLRQAFPSAADLTELLCGTTELDMTPSQSYLDV